MIGAASLIGETVYFANLRDHRRRPRFKATNGDKVWSFPSGAYNPVISDGKRLYLTGYKHIYSLKVAPEGARAKKKSGQKQP